MIYVEVINSENEKYKDSIRIVSLGSKIIGIKGYRLVK